MRLFLLIMLAVASQRGLAQTQPDQVVNTKFERGKLANGQPKGEWKYFDSKGKPELSIDYDNGVITYQRPDSSLHLLRIGDRWELLRPTRVPRLLGSHDRYAAAVCKELRYPIIALRTQTQGTVRLGFTVSSTGQIQDAQIESTPSKELAQEVLRALGEQNDTWLPAVYQGQPYDSRLFIVVHFTYRDSFNAPKKNHTDLAHAGNTRTTLVTSDSHKQEKPGQFLEFMVENIR